MHLRTTKHFELLWKYLSNEVLSYELFARRWNLCSLYFPSYTLGPWKPTAWLELAESS